MDALKGMIIKKYKLIKLIEITKTTKKFILIFLMELSELFWIIECLLNPIWDLAKKEINNENCKYVEIVGNTKRLLIKNDVNPPATKIWKVFWELFLKFFMIAETIHIQIKAHIVNPNKPVEVSMSNGLLWDLSHFAGE